MGGQRQAMARQMRDFHPWRYQKPDIVREHEKARFPLLHIPTDIGVPVAAFPRRGSEHEARQYRAVIAAYDIFHILADGAVVAKVVVLVDQRLELSQTGTLFDRVDAEWAQHIQPADYRRRVVLKVPDSMPRALPDRFQWRRKLDAS